MYSLIIKVHPSLMFTQFGASTDCSVALPKSSYRLAPEDVGQARKLHSTDPRLPSAPFSQNEVDRLSQPRQWLNDDCVNGCMQLLMHCDIAADNDTA